MVADLGINGAAYDQFSQRPSASCADGAHALVALPRRHNPFFYDKADRVCIRARQEGEAPPLGFASAVKPKLNVRCLV